MSGSASNPGQAQLGTTLSTPTMPSLEAALRHGGISPTLEFCVQVRVSIASPLVWTFPEWEEVASALSLSGPAQASLALRPSASAVPERAKSCFDAMADSKYVCIENRSAPRARLRAEAKQSSVADQPLVRLGSSRLVPTKHPNFGCDC
jgi:hypothetical protein